MGDYDSGSIRPDDDYHRARDTADRAGHDYEGNQSWKQAQDDMFRAQQEMEWQRRDREHDAAAAARNANETYAAPGDPSAPAARGASSYGPAVAGGRVSMAIADSLANSVAGMTRTHPGLFRFVFRLIARLMCWPIPVMQRALDKRGVSNSLVRLPILLFGWMAYLMLLAWVLLHSGR